MTSPPPAPTPPPPVIPGRGTPFVEYALRRIRASRVLQVSLVLAFLSYGGLSVLLVSDRLGARFPLVGVVAFLSLASWFFLFHWYPALERTWHVSQPERQWLPRALESFAIGCVAIVHAMLAIMVVYLARR